MQYKKILRSRRTPKRESFALAVRLLKDNDFAVLVDGVPVVLGIVESKGETVEVGLVVVESLAVGVVEVRIFGDVCEAIAVCVGIAFEEDVDVAVPGGDEGGCCGQEGDGEEVEHV